MGASGNNSINASSSGNCGCQLPAGCSAASWKRRTASMSARRGARAAWATISFLRSTGPSTSSCAPAACISSSSRKWPTIWRQNWRASAPEASASWMTPRPRALSASSQASTTASTAASGAVPNTSCARWSVMRSSGETTSWSSRLSASRTLPDACRASSSTAPGSMASASRSASQLSRPAISGVVSSRKLNCWQRDLMVTGTLCSSVVARTKMVWAGGSSSVFNSALKAAMESMWTSSMI